MQPMGAQGPRAALEELRALRASRRIGLWCQDLGVSLLVAFGSAVDDTIADPGDLDLAVLLDAGRTKWLRDLRLQALAEQTADG
jgi:hypothetical protein